MAHPPTPIPSRAPALRTVLTLVVALAACSERSSPVGPEFAVELEVAFDVSTAWSDLFVPDEVDRVRATALVATSGDTLDVFEEDWDPDGDAWLIELKGRSRAGAALELIVQVEILDGDAVAWSGRSTLADVSTPARVSVSLFRGPLANLGVNGIAFVGGPATLDEGSTTRLDAEVAGQGAAFGDVRIFWWSTDPAVATVDAEGVVTGVLPGTASILAVAGPAGDTTTVEVEVVAAGVLLDPPTLRLTSLTERATVQAAVVDARGDTVGGFDLLWSSTDSTVLLPLGDGLFEATSPGQAEVVVGVVDAAGVEGRVPVTVRQAVSTATLSADTLHFGALDATDGLTVTAEDAAGFGVPGVEVGWVSADSTVATVDGSGLVTARGNGTEEITGHVSSGGADTVSVSAVVRVDQIVVDVDVSPADTVVLGPGSSVQFVAQALDANAHPVGDASLVWSSSDGSVATIDAQGLVSTSGQGVTTIEVQADGVVAATELTVLTTGGVSRVWVGGDATDPADWSNQSNWLPRLVPTLVDTVLIRASAAHQPRLSSDRSVAGLAVEPGATVELEGFTLTVTEDLDAGNPLIGPGTVRMIGDGHSVRGALPALVVNGDLDVSGPLTVSGDLTVDGVGAGLDVGGASVSVSGALRVQSDGTLTMRDPAGVMDVDGEAIFDGGSTLGLLSAGELRIGGNFTAWTSDPRNFAPTGSHRTVLDGDVIQIVYLHFSAPAEARFHDLEIDNPGGVSLRSTIRVTGDVALAAGVLDGAQTVVLDGDLIETIGGNQYRVLNTVFTGSPALPASVQTNATFTDAYALGQDLEVIGSVVVSGAGAALDVGGHSVRVGGSLSTEDGATLLMRDPSGVMDVAGNAFFDGGSTLGLLTAGELRVGGDFTAWTSDPESFAPTGSHRTVLDGSTAQSVYLHHSGAGESRFQELELDNPTGASLFQTTRVTSDVVLTRGVLDGAQTMHIGGDLTELVGGNQYRVLHTTFSGSPTLPASVQTNATFTAPFAPSQDVEIVGDLMIRGGGADLDVGPWTVSVTGAFRTSDGATLTMQDPAGILDVEGDAEFDGGSTLGLLTDGELRVAGNLTAWTSHTENFAPTGAHLTTLDGTSVQTVYMFYNGSGQARFEDVAITNASGVTFTDTVRVTDALTVSTSLSVGAGATTLVAGLFTLEATATLVNDGSVQANSCQLLGTVVGNAPVC